MREYIRFHRFPLAGIDAMSADSVRSFPRHTHDQFGIGVIDWGGHASLSDRGQIEAASGNLIFVNPGEVHDGRPINRQFRSWRMLYLDPPVVEGARADILEGSGRYLTFAAPVFVDATLRSLFDRLFAFSAAGMHPDSMACETALLQVVARARINSTARPTRVTKQTPSIRKIRSRIDADPSASLTLAALATESGLSRFQLIRAFAQQLGLTPHAYIIQQRIALARRLMRGGRPLAEAATGAGFFDQSHFNRCFVRQFGVTPGYYTNPAV
jgi:AraC-like DNA-binding protein